MTEPNIVRTETCKILSYRDDKQSNVEEVELELIAKLVPYLWNEDGDKISFAVICVPLFSSTTHAFRSLDITASQLADDSPQILVDPRRSHSQRMLCEAGFHTDRNCQCRLRRQSLQALQVLVAFDLCVSAACGRTDPVTSLEA